MAWKGKERFSVTSVQMFSRRGLLGITKIGRIPNARLRVKK